MSNPNTVDEFDYAEGWKPEPGSTVVGRIVRIDAGWSDYRAESTGDGTYPIITIANERDGGKPVAVHGFQTALFNRLRQDRPRVGERIGIKFVEIRQHRHNPRMSVAVYRVRIEGRTGEDVWNRLAKTQPTDRTQNTVPAPTATALPGAEAYAPDATVSGEEDDDIPF